MNSLLRGWWKGREKGKDRLKMSQRARKKTTFLLPLPPFLCLLSFSLPLLPFLPPTPPSFSLFMQAEQFLINTSGFFPQTLAAPSSSFITKILYFFLLYI